MIDGVPEVADFVASGLARRAGGSDAHPIYATDPEVHRQINRALADRGRAAAARRAGAA